MDIKRLAREAIKVFAKVRDQYGGHNHALLEGYFEGVSNGTIKCGQAWVIDVIRGEKGFLPRFDPSDYEVIKAVVSSGMCCQGQLLSGARGKGFAEREA